MTFPLAKAGATRYELAMLPGSSFAGVGRLRRNASRSVLLALVVFQGLATTRVPALPRRLILAVDAVAYRDMKALQEGVTYRDLKGRQFHRHAFYQGYFPVSRMVSTFPSASDVAWTEILGDRPLPGYQRTYYSGAANLEIAENGVTTSMEYERQMTWRVEGGFRHAMDFVLPLKAFKYEARELVERFMSCTNRGDNYYAFITSTDGAQHLSGDIFAILCALDAKLQELRARYRAREGRDLEIVLLSDHGNNHAGAGKRVGIRAFLKQAGYRLATSITEPKDVVLPTAGIESWVEIHNAPAETERLVSVLCGLEGVDLLTARIPGQPARFMVMNARGERATIEWSAASNSFKYSPETGDPLGYGPVVEALASRKQLDAEGFATADAWMRATIAHRYPLALERIVRGHTRVTLNPATILISLKNGYVHAGWFIKKGSEFVTFGGTHGALDDLNSTGMLLSSFTPTPDTSSSRVAALFGGFEGLRDYRAEETGAEWVARGSEALTRIARAPLDRNLGLLPADGVCLRVWTPAFTRFGSDAPIDVTVNKARYFSNAEVRRGDPKPADAGARHLVLHHPISLEGEAACERVYALPPGLNLEPGKEYRISGRIRDSGEQAQVFKFTFRTDSRGQPVVY